MSWWNKYIRVPFEEKGRTMQGADCWGLVKLIYEQERGIILPSYEELYETTNDREVLGRLIESERAQHWTNPPIEDHKEFDVILLKMRNMPMHVGVVTKKNHMIHCSKGIGTSHPNFTGMEWKHLVVGLGRYE